MKSHGVVGVCWLVVGRWVRGVSEPTSGCVLRWDRWPWEGEPLEQAAREVRSLLVITMGSGARHFPTVCDSVFGVVFWIP